MLEDTVEYIEGEVIENTVPEATEEDVHKILKKLQEAERPLIIAGGGVIATHAQDLLASFAEKLHIPVVSAFRRFNILSNVHYHYAGWLVFGISKQILEEIQNAYVILILYYCFS